MFIPISTGGASSLCSKNWFQYHWQENDYGYRDKAIAIPTVAGKRNILIVGDSYVAGHGIDDPTNRFSDLLSNQIKASFHTFNLGVCGIDTHEEFEGMLKYPVEGDIIVLTHTPNDIRDVAPTKQKKVLPSSSFGSFISESSFLVNFIKLNYSNYVQTTAAEELKSSFQSVEEFIESELSSNHLVSHYNDKVILSNHFSQLDRFINYARENNKILIVLLFPLLSENNFDISNEYMNSHLEHYLIKNKALVINLHPVLENIPAEDRIVGRYDNHPSELVHERVADHLSAFLVNLITESARKAH